MKNLRAFIVLLALSFVVITTCVSLNGGCKLEQGNPEDNRVVHTTYVSMLETGVVERILTNFDGISLVRVGYGKGDNFARYALTTDSSVTNGTTVKLIQISHDDSAESTHVNGFRFNSRFAVRLNK